MLINAQRYFCRQLVLIFCAVILLCPVLNAMLQRDNDEEMARRFFFNGPKHTSRWYDALETLRYINSSRATISADRSLNDNQRAMLNTQLNALQAKIINGLEHDNKYGRAIAAGLAGNEWKALQNESIDGIRDGIELGLVVRASKACGDALGSRVAESADSLIGGVWDVVIGFITGMCSTLYQDVFHSGEKAFNVDHVKDWQNLANGTFENLERLLRDGLKDSLRGHDMTLRNAAQTVDQAEPDKAELLNGWRILVQGYIRQFDYIISRIEHSVIYYDGDEAINFAANELKRRLVEVNQLLIHGTTLKEFDGFLDSNKAIIPALKKNIQAIFTQLLGHIETKKQSTRSTAGTTTPMRRDVSRDHDDGGFPHPMR